MKAVKRTYDAGRNWCFGWQCESCGSWKAQSIRKFPLTQKFELFDESKKDKWLDEIRQKFNREKEQQDHEWRQRYERHLESEYWKRIRRLVMDRDRSICQGCLIVSADHVHHLTYERLGEELAIDLISVCWECHGKLHGLEKVNLSALGFEDKGIPF